MRIEGGNLSKALMCNVASACLAGLFVTALLLASSAPLRAMTIEQESPLLNILVLAIACILGAVSTGLMLFPWLEAYNRRGDDWR